LESDGSEIANEADVLSSGVVVGEDGAGLSSVVGVSVDGTRKAGAELDVELVLQKS
jgi:hypothetical protein